MKEPNRIKPEMHGRVELIEAKSGKVLSTLAAEEGDYLFELVHSDEYSDKYMLLPCSSSMRCTHEGNMTLEFVKDQSQAVLILPSPSELNQPAQMLWVDLF